MKALKIILRYRGNKLQSTLHFETVLVKNLTVKSKIRKLLGCLKCKYANFYVPMPFLLLQALKAELVHIRLVLIDPSGVS